MKKRRNYEDFRAYCKSHSIVHYAIKKGLLVRPDNCSECGSAAKKIEGHHENYHKPLEVIWLCKVCHRNKHRIHKLSEAC